MMASRPWRRSAVGLVGLVLGSFSVHAAEPSPLWSRLFLKTARVYQLSIWQPDFGTGPAGAGVGFSGGLSWSPSFELVAGRLWVRGGTGFDFVPGRPISGTSSLLFRTHLQGAAVYRLKPAWEISLGGGLSTWWGGGTAPVIFAGGAWLPPDATSKEGFLRRITDHVDHLYAEVGASLLPSQTTLEMRLGLQVRP